MTTRTRQRPRIGDERYQVEWCSRLAFYADSTDVDHDRCEMSVAYFADHDEARQFAESIWPKTHDTFGVVEVDLVEFVPYDDDDAVTMPHVGYWEHRGTTEIFSGEWE